jgi:transposase InsO family protein
MRRLSEAHPRWGYRQIHALLVAEGWKVNRKRIERLWRLEGLRVPPSKTKTSGRKAGGGSQNAIWNLPALYPDHIWTFDFMTDRTVDGVAFRILNVVDEYTRVCVECDVARNIGARRVIWVLERLFADGVKPKIIRSDNGPEFIARVLGTWLGEQGVSSAFVEKGSPQQNAFIESFNAGMRRECLNVEEFHSVLEARVVIAAHVEEYNTVRRHRALGMLTPAEFARRARQNPTLRPVVDRSSQTGKNIGGSRKRGR